MTAIHAIAITHRRGARGLATLLAAAAFSVVWHPSSVWAQQRAARQDGSQQQPQRQGASQQTATQQAAAPPQASAPNGTTLRIGGGHSDNLLRVPTAPEAGGYRAIGLASNWAYGSRRFAAQLNSDLEYRDYTVASLDNELYGFAELAGQIQAVPQRFAWSFGDNFGQGRFTPFVVSGPQNRDRVNIVSTGPILNVPAGRRTFLRLADTESKRSLKILTQLDSRVRLPELDVIRLLSTTTRVSLNLSDRHVDYDTISLSNANNEIQTATLGYRRILATGLATLAVGHSRLYYGTRALSTPLVDLGWRRHVGARSQLSVSADRQFADALGDFRFANPTDVLLSADVYKRTGVQTLYRVDAARNTFSFGAYAVKSEYVNNVSLENRMHTVRADFTRLLSRNLVLSFGASRANRHYTRSGRRDDESTWRLSLLKGSRRGFSFEGIYEHTSQRGLQPGNINENVVRLYFQYGFVRSTPGGASSLPPEVEFPARLSTPLM